MRGIIAIILSIVLATITTLVVGFFFEFFWPVINSFDGVAGDPMLDHVVRIEHVGVFLAPMVLIGTTVVWAVIWYIRRERRVQPVRR